MPLYTLYELLIYIFWLSFAKALLLHRDIQPFAEYAVAPLVGAWIETRQRKSIVSKLQSHPSWVRGLKRLEIVLAESRVVSHPSWVRGLKLKPCTQSFANFFVAPLVGAWIETCKLPDCLSSSRRTPRGCVD